jgi:hypothetical protein
MPHVALLGLGDRVVVHINNLVQVANQDPYNLVQLAEVILSTGRVDEGRKRERSQVADSNFVRSTVLNDLRAKIGAANSSQVLLVALLVAGILVKHEGVASLGLSLKNSIPKLLGLDGLTATAFFLVSISQSAHTQMTGGHGGNSLFIKSIKLVAVNICQARGFIGTEQSPVTVGLNSLHEQIRGPQSVEQITGSDFLLTVVLAEIQELKDIGVPRLKVNSKSARALVSSLVDVPGSVVEHAKHRNNTVRRTVGATNVGACGTDAVNIKTDTAGGLRDHGTSLEGVVDTFNAILLHINEEARRQLGLGSTSIEQGRRSMSEVFLGHEMVGLNGLLDIVTVNANGNTHQQVLGTLSNLAVDS